MRCTEKICKNCNDIYNYYLSGNGIDSETNNDRYCPSCMKKVSIALSIALEDILKKIKNKEK